MIQRTRACITDRFFIFCLILSSLLPGGAALAVSGDGMTAYPADSRPDDASSESWFTFSLDRGQSKRDSLIIVNDSDQDQTVDIFAVDSAGSAKDGIGGWITLETGTLTLAPDEEKEIGFTITIPEDAPAGEIPGEIVIEKKVADEAVEDGSAPAENAHIAIRIFATVPEAEVRKLDFGKYSFAFDKETGNYILSLTIENEGNVPLEPIVQIESTDLIFGSQNETGMQKMVMPADSEATITFQLPRAKVGQFKINPALSFAGVQTMETVTYPHPLYFWALPWTAINIAASILLLYVLFWIFRALKEHTEKKYYKNYRVEPSENLESLADKLGVSWKKIVRLNRLKPPYQIAKGQLITVYDKRNVLDQPYIKKGMIPVSRTKAIDTEWENWKEDDAAVESEPAAERPRHRTALLLIGIVGIGLSLWACLFYLETSNVKNDSDDTGAFAETASGPVVDENTETTTPDETAETAAISAEESIIQPELSDYDRANIKITILNGSGIKGVSSAASSAFRAKGYSAVETGNADSFDHITTLLECGAGMDERICEEAQAILLPDYPGTELISNDKLAADKIEIILGQ